MVFPSKIPERNDTLSDSFLCVTIADWPGRLLSRSDCIASISRLSPAGHPSMMPPIAGPCDSPKVVNLNTVPKLFPIFGWVRK